MDPNPSEGYMGNCPSDDFTGNYQTSFLLRVILRNAGLTGSYQYRFLEVVISIKFCGPRLLSKQARVAGAAAFGENSWTANEF